MAILEMKNVSKAFGGSQALSKIDFSVEEGEIHALLGENGAGTVDMGSGGMGFNPAAMMASMAVGGVVGQNIAGAMGKAMSGMNQATPGAVPPPIPVTMYHVAVNGQATGPFDMTTLQQMAAAGQLVADTLVWKAGMAQWAKAGTVEELKPIIMPPIPPQA